MTTPVYKLSLLTALLLLSAYSYGKQVDPVTPVPVEPMNTPPVTNDIKVPDLSRLTVPLEPLQLPQFNEQLLALQKGVHTLRQNSDALRNEISKGFNGIAEGSIRSGNQQNDKQYDYQKIKNYTKSYPADANDLFNLSTVYGSVTVNTWTKSEVKVEVQIKAMANDEAMAQNGLDMVTINDSKEGNQINFSTRFEEDSRYNLWRHGNHHNIEVKYMVYMPARLALEARTAYCNVNLPDLSGEVKLRSTYGDVTAERLSNAASEISSSYCNVKIGAYNGNRISQAYGNLTIGEASDFKANVSYGDISLSRLKGNVNLNLAYVTHFKIGEVNDALKNLHITATYSDLDLGFPSRSNFDFDVVVTYADFKYDDSRVNITNRTPEPGSRGYNPTKTYQGTYGKGNADAKVTIKSAYGNVNFN